MRSRTHAEVHIWLSEVEISEKRVAHERVVMLTSVDEDVPDCLSRRPARIGEDRIGLAVVVVDCRDDRRSLHEIWTRPHDRNDFHPVNPGRMKANTVLALPRLGPHRLHDRDNLSHNAIQDDAIISRWLDGPSSSN